MTQAHQSFLLCLCTDRFPLDQFWTERSTLPTISCLPCIATYTPDGCGYASLQHTSTPTPPPALHTSAKGPPLLAPSSSARPLRSTRPLRAPVRFNALLFNVHGLTLLKWQTLKTIATNHKVQVIVLTETDLGVTPPPYITAYHTSTLFLGAPLKTGTSFYRGGVAVICLDDYTLERTIRASAYCPSPATHQILPCTVSHTPTGWATGLIVSYSSPEKVGSPIQQFYIALSFLLDDNSSLPRPLPCLLIGDFNAYVGTEQEEPWGLAHAGGLHHPPHRTGDPQILHQPALHPSEQSTGRGRHLLNLINQHGLLILNGRCPQGPLPPFTCYHGLGPAQSASIIDYALITRQHFDLILTCLVLDEPLLSFSDHNAVLIRLQTASRPHSDPGVLPGVPLRTFYNTHKLDNPGCLQKFQALWHDNLPFILTAFQ